MRWIWIDKFIEFTPRTSATSIKNVTLAEEHLHDLFAAAGRNRAAANARSDRAPAPRRVLSGRLAPRPKLRRSLVEWPAAERVDAAQSFGPPRLV